jgi:hypothetical protein
MIIMEKNFPGFLVLVNETQVQLPGGTGWKLENL